MHRSRRRPKKKKKTTKKSKLESSIRWVKRYISRNDRSITHFAKFEKLTFQKERERNRLSSRSSFAIRPPWLERTNLFQTTGSPSSPFFLKKGENELSQTTKKIRRLKNDDDDVPATTAEQRPKVKRPKWQNFAQGESSSRNSRNKKYPHKECC